MNNKICLVGFMGCGKSTLGKLLSNVLDKTYVDLDEYIEAENNSLIAEIFSSYGEQYFRQLENEALKNVLKSEVDIIATGGGIISVEENIELLKECNTFYLEHDFDTLYNRISGDSLRPLVTSYVELKERYESRIDSYKTSCKHIINCEGKTVQDIVQEVIKGIE